MLVQQKGEAQTEAWKDLVSRLPGVLNAEFVMEGNAVREVHVLSDQSRYPKQIVRDIQSAMAARFQIDIDHRIISVAQIPSFASEHAKKRLLCHRLELSSSRDGITAAVVLELNGEQKRGESISTPSTYNRSRCIAEATVGAINSFLGPSCQFALVEWKNVPLGDREVIMIGLSLSCNGKTEFLVGACPSGEDPNLSVVSSTLDAVNRRISKLSFSSTNDF